MDELVNYEEMLKSILVEVFITNIDGTTKVTCMSQTKMDIRILVKDRPFTVICMLATAAFADALVDALAKNHDITAKEFIDKAQSAIDLLADGVSVIGNMAQLKREDDEVSFAHGIKPDFGDCEVDEEIPTEFTDFFKKRFGS